MVILDDLMAFLDAFMGDGGDKDPYMPNGLQVRGREQIKLLATGVSASLRLFQEVVTHKVSTCNGDEQCQRSSPGGYRSCLHGEP